MQANKSVALRAIESNVKAKRPEISQMFSYFLRSISWSMESILMSFLQFTTKTVKSLKGAEAG